MQTFLIVLLLGLLVLIGLFILGVVRNKEQKAKFIQITIAQGKRTKLSDQDFCANLSLSPENLPLVSAIRKKLARRGSYNPELIYPDDELWNTFDFQLGDFIDEFSYEFIKCDCGELPYEELKQVGDLVKCLVVSKKSQGTKK